MQDKFVDIKDVRRIMPVLLANVQADPETNFCYFFVHAIYVEVSCGGPDLWKSVEASSLFFHECKSDSLHVISMGNDAANERHCGDA